MTDVDLDLVVAEILVEAQRRRDTGEISEAYERELDAEFARHAPAGVGGEDFDLLMDRAERASYVDVDVPVASRLPGVGLVKQVLRKLMAWYMRYVAQQVTVVGGTLTRSLRLLDARLRHLEDGTVGAGPVRVELDRADAAPRQAHLEDTATAALQGTTGRVLVASCGRAELVATLVGAGISAYGVESRRALLVDALRQGLDVRPDDSVEHLRALPDGALGGVVLVDVVEWLPPAALVGLVLHASRVLAPGGRLVVVSATPEAWAAHRDRVTVDLAPGRPWHAETWEALLRNRGFIDVVTTSAPVLGSLARLEGTDAVAAAFNANAAALEPLVAAAPGYVVQAHRRA